LACVDFLVEKAGQKNLEKSFDGALIEKLKPKFEIFLRSDLHIGISKFPVPVIRKSQTNRKASEHKFVMVRRYQLTDHDRNKPCFSNTVPGIGY